MREQPLTRKMIYGKLRRYKCRECGNAFIIVDYSE